ncbi:hypothetical protein [Pseudoalteromonas sp. P1-9]|uniref:hypothetical protein n=1 Tax=Pseudoalteromonas sp. P1-9 TaxID=1710354 RepID=UPI00128EC432|nr:hypothetical protein [Pseudoalteromonas sp. P1-9]
MIRVNSKTKSSIFMFRSGFPVIDSVLNWATYYSVTSTACVLLEGAYLQKFYNIQYYTKFNGLDINVMLGVCALLLWYVSLHIFKMGQELLFKPEEVVIAAETGTQSEITQ